jgi:hypothetical protein
MKRAVLFLCTALVLGKAEDKVAILPQAKVVVAEGKGEVKANATMSPTSTTAAPTRAEKSQQDKTGENYSIYLTLTLISLSWALLCCYASWYFPTVLPCL